MLSLLCYLFERISHKSQRYNAGERVGQWIGLQLPLCSQYYVEWIFETVKDNLEVISYTKISINIVFLSSGSTFFGTRLRYRFTLQFSETDKPEDQKHVVVVWIYITNLSNFKYNIQIVSVNLCIMGLRGRQRCGFVAMSLHAFPVQEYLRRVESKCLHENKNRFNDYWIIRTSQILISQKVYWCIIFDILKYEGK